MYPRAALKFALLAQLASLASATYSDPKVLDACPGYKAKNVLDLGHKLTADLVLAGTACNVFGNDTEKLKLEVTYESRKSIHSMRRRLGPYRTRRVSRFVSSIGARAHALILMPRADPGLAR